MNLEQHFLNKNGKSVIRKILFNFNLLNKSILELGSGKGDLTEEILIKEPKEIIGVEINTQLKNKVSTSNKFVLLNKNIKELDFALFEGFICISAPPYSLIEHIHLELNKMEYILVVSGKYFKYFDDFKIIGELKENMFIPNSNKRHYIITNIKD